MAEASTEKALLVYIGPSLPDAGLKACTVYRGESEEQILESLADAFKRYPDAAKLFVPVEKLQEARTKTAKTGTLYHKYYANLKGLADAKQKGGR